MHFSKPRLLLTLGARRKLPSSGKSSVQAGVTGCGRLPGPPSETSPARLCKRRATAGRHCPLPCARAGRARTRALADLAARRASLGVVSWVESAALPPAEQRPRHPEARTPSLTSLTPSDFQDPPPATPHPPRVPRPSGPGATPPHSACSLATPGLPALHKYLVLGQAAWRESQEETTAAQHLFYPAGHLQLAAPELEVGLADPHADKAEAPHPFPSFFFKRHPPSAARLRPPRPGAPGRCGVEHPRRGSFCPLSLFCPSPSHLLVLFASRSQNR